MKLQLRLSVFLLTASVCSSAGLPPSAWSAVRPAGSEKQGNAESAQTSPRSRTADATIPGPLRSFLRMAGISQKVSREEVLPLTARNVVMYGYQDLQARTGKPTEYLILLRRYIDQARELRVLAGREGVIRVPSCGDAKPLLMIIGYRLRQPCGADTSVETSDPDRAFLTIDSGFPLADLEETLRGGKPFTYSYASSQVPVLFTPGDWTAVDKNDRSNKRIPRDDVVDALLRDPALARLYWALARIDSETGNALRVSPGLPKLVPFAAVLDFYGNQICIRAGRVVVPGGAPAEAGWKNLVGVGPDSPGEFVARLLAKDEGWLATYFDAVSRLSESQQAYFTGPRQLPRFYEALRGQDNSPGPAKPVFRPDPGLLLLMTRLQFDPNGQPHVPGNLEVWKEILSARRRSDSKIVREWAKRAGQLNKPEQLLEGMFAFSRVSSTSGPLQIFLIVSEIDRGRSAEQRLSPQTVRLLAEKHSRFSDQYPIFSEFHGLTNASIARFLSVAESLGHIPDRIIRANALGIMQANVGLWEILARQGQISNASLNDSWLKVIDPFAEIGSAAQLFDASRTSLAGLLRPASGRTNLSQDEIIALLAGPNQATPDGQQMRQVLATRIRSVVDDQRLVSLDTILALADGLNDMAQGAPVSDTLIPLAKDLREFEMPRPFFTPTERSEWATGLYNNSHTALEMHTDLTKIIKSPGSHNELAQARGQLTPFLRDTLVGLNYAYYEPPAAQTLHNNPLFVRFHDFSGDMAVGTEQSWQTPSLFGRGWAASGGGHLVGSLADLPYVLARVEQDFTVPENVQALIWDELVPGLLINAVLPRWWGVSRDELHAVTLYQRTGEELLTASVNDETLRKKVMTILSDRMLPRRMEEVEGALRSGGGQEILPQLTPADVFYLTAEFRQRFPAETDSWGAAGRELEGLSRRDPESVSLERLSKDFGVPHPILTQSYTRELLNVKPFPSFMGYPSRLLAESWDSNNLYWARLADELGYPPEMLNRLVPELTHRMVEKIFATDFEDSPAVLRAMRETGEEFRRGAIASLPKAGATPGP
jgi:hypothetical protein